MTNYKKLVEALRCIELRLSCNECEYGTYSESGEAWSCECERRDADAAAAIEALQAEVPKRGEWIYDGKFAELHKFYCSKCKRTEFRMSDFCPNCGADMRDTEANNG